MSEAEILTRFHQREQREKKVGDGEENFYQLPSSKTINQLELQANQQEDVIRLHQAREVLSSLAGTQSELINLSQY